VSGKVDIASGLEERARALLARDVARIDARTRSRLNQARHAALSAGLEPRPGIWRSRKLMPVTGAVAAVAAVAVLLLHGSGGTQRPTSLGVSPQPSLEVLDLLTSDESMSLMENYDRGFYEWAAAQAESSQESPSSAVPTT
jgi:anti-sigma-K factor RskA